MLVRTLFLGLLVAAGAAAHDHSEPHEHTLPPMPTESIGCKAHDEHWHCDAPAPTGVTASTTPTVINTESVSPAPSPTESAGCVLHDEHWHCDGPAESAAATPSSPAVTVVAPRQVLVAAGGLAALVGFAV